MCSETQPAELTELKDRSPEKVRPLEGSRRWWTPDGGGSGGRAPETVADLGEHSAAHCTGVGSRNFGTSPTAFQSCRSAERIGQCTVGQQGDGCHFSAVGLSASAAPPTSQWQNWKPAARLVTEYAARLVDTETEMQLQVSSEAHLRREDAAALFLLRRSGRLNLACQRHRWRLGKLLHANRSQPACLATTTEKYFRCQFWV